MSMRRIEIACGFLDPSCTRHTDATYQDCLSGSAGDDEIEFSTSVSGFETDAVGGMFREPCKQSSLSDELILLVSRKLR